MAGVVVCACLSLPAQKRLVSSVSHLTPQPYVRFRENSTETVPFVLLGGRLGKQENFFRNILLSVENENGVKLLDGDRSYKAHRLLLIDHFVPSDRMLSTVLCVDC